MVTVPFKPLFWLQDPVFQSLLGAFAPTDNPLPTIRKEVMLQEDGRYEYFVTPPPQNASVREYVVIVHAWLGSAFAPYVLAAAKRAHQLGYGVVRIHLRDHGGNEALTVGPFHTARLEEFSLLMEHLRRSEPMESYSMVTFSVGANYALRFAIQQPKGLKKMVAISPYVYLSDALKNIDRKSFWQRKVLYKGLVGMVRRKAKAHPNRYAAEILQNAPKTCYDGVTYLVKHYYGFSSAEEYYAKSDLRLFPVDRISVPLLVLVAKDDPISDVENFPQVKWPSHAEMHYTEKGGHIGFLHQNSFPDTGHRWAQYEAMEFIKASRDS